MSILIIVGIMLITFSLFRVFFAMFRAVLMIVFVIVVVIAFACSDKEHASKTSYDENQDYEPPIHELAGNLAQRPEFGQE